MFDTKYSFLSKIFLELISTNQKFKNSFQVIAPEIYADIESASTNPNCSCRIKIEKYVLENKEKCVQFLNNFIVQNNLSINKNEIESKYKTTIYSGKSIEVKIQEWENFSKKLAEEKAVFRSFSVVLLDKETIKVFFL